GIGSSPVARRRCSVAMRLVSAGQKSGQRVKTKSAIHTCPASVAAVTGAPLRSVSANAGTVPRTGSGAGRQPHQAATPTAVATTRPAATSGPRRASVVRFRGRGTLSVGEGTGDGPQVGQQREHQQHAED